MRKEQILNIPSMPISAISYPRGPYRFVDRQYLVVTYESDPEAIREHVPEPLAPDGSNTVFYEFMRMPDSSGFGDYTESGVVIPCVFKGEAVNFTSQMYLNDEPPISGGREIWGFPKKYADPTLNVIKDTLTGHLRYAEETVAVATMGYKHENIISKHTGEAINTDAAAIIKKLGKTQVNLKLIPDVDGRPAIAQLVAYNMVDINLKGAWEGPARLHLVPHVNAPVADLPVKRIKGGLHMIADLTLPFGRVIYDYLKDIDIIALQSKKAG